MESTDITGITKARDLEKNTAGPEVSVANKKDSTSGHGADERPDSQHSSTMAHEHSSFMRWVEHANLVTAGEVVLFCTFSLIFQNVKIDGKWHDVSRRRLFDAVPITCLIQAIFCSAEIVVVKKLKKRNYTSNDQFRVHRIQIHYWRGIMTFCRWLCPIIAALIIVSHAMNADADDWTRN